MISKLCLLISFLVRERESALLAAARYMIPTSGQEAAQEGRRMAFFAATRTVPRSFRVWKLKRREILLLLCVFDSENSNCSN